MKIKVENIINKNIVEIKENKFKESEVTAVLANIYDYILVKSDEGKVLDVIKCKNDKQYKQMNWRIIEKDYTLDTKEYNGEMLLVKDEEKIIGIITYEEIIDFLEQEYNKLNEELESVKTDLEAFMKCSEDLTCISDGFGSKVRLSSSAEKYYGVKPEELIGKTVDEVEKMGIYFPSATKLAIKEKKQITIVQKTATGRKLLVTATPVIDENGNIKRVVSISKDITDEEKLKSELKHLKELVEKYEYELSTFRKKNTEIPNIVYRSKVMDKLIEMVDKIAIADSTVLIYGETGVGKELIAKYIHCLSKRNKGPYVKINCAAIPESLLEAELFGYEKGAFTGAKNEGKPGLVEVADKGTLFLDEIGELPLSLQAKLLRVIQEKEFLKVGGVKPIKVDVRIIAATNRNLKEMVESGAFRKDLYYRLNVIPITIPPLRERVEDIPVLAYHFLNLFNEKYGKSKELTTEVIEVFTKYPWPGNVRELENIIERLVIISRDDKITKNDLPVELINEEVHTNKTTELLTKHWNLLLSDDVLTENSNHIPAMSLKEVLAKLEYELIKRAVERYGSTYKAAKVLGVDQSTVCRKLRKYQQRD